MNYDGLLGPLAAEALANTYWPEQNRGVGSTMVRYAGDIGWKFGGNLLRQYWPQINRKLRLAPPPRTDFNFEETLSSLQNVFEGIQDYLLGLGRQQKFSAPAT